MDFRQHLDWLRQQGQLIVIDDAVEPYLEAAEIIRQFSGQPSPPAVLFSQLSGCSYSAVANLFYSSDPSHPLCHDGRLIQRALADVPGQVPAIQPLASWLKTQSTCQIGENLGTFHEQSYEQTALVDVPMLQYWPGDAGPYLSLSLGIVRGLNGTVHCGIYRFQRHDSHHLTLHCLPGSVTQKIYKEYQQNNTPMPIAIVSGVDTLLHSAAMLPLPRDIDTLGFVRWLSGGKFDCVTSPVHGIPIPRQCEILIEGSVAVAKTAMDGPHGNFRGYYSRAVTSPVVAVEQVWARPDAICPITVVGGPPTESFLLAHARLPYVQWSLMREFEWIHDVQWIRNAEYDNALIVQVNKAPTSAALKMFLEHRQVQKGRLIVLVDMEAKLSDPYNLLWRCLRLPWEKAVQQDGERMVINACCDYGKKRLESDPVTRQRAMARVKAWKKKDGNTR